MKRSLALFTLLLATLVTYNVANATLMKASYEGQVVNVIPDEEGTNVMMKVKGGEFKALYIPRSNSNIGVTQKAIDAFRTKRHLKISL